MSEQRQVIRVRARTKLSEVFGLLAASCVPGFVFMLIIGHVTDNEWFIWKSYYLIPACIVFLFLTLCAVIMETIWSTAVGTKVVVQTETTTAESR